jgi:hypothetical protein
MTQPRGRSRIDGSALSALFTSLVGAIHANELPVKVINGANCCVDLHGLTFAIGIFCADKNTVMRGMLSVESNEVAPVPREDCTSLRHCKFQNLCVADSPIVAPRFAHGKHIMTELAKHLYDFERKVLIRIEV